MLTYRTHLIAREGWRFVAIMALLGLVLHISLGFIIAIPFWIATLLLCVLFRDPRRQVPPKPLAIISPVDGRVFAIDTLQDPYTQQQVLQIQINKGIFDVMTARSPMEGKINKQWFAIANTIEAVNNINEAKLQEPATCQVESMASGMDTTQCRFAQWIQSDEQDNIVMAVKSATHFFKPRCYSHSGDRIGQGQRCGFIPFHAVVLVSVPVSSRLEVNIGDLVRGGSDTLATLMH
ncbi:MAG: hypothetical protein AMJ53_17150 [Gammaproteobacteria bacterium SG8_11]|nr:MAG: hypothetical protein AMJ53_17150 [Gammaproteobacteria bacterium SG8_11]